MSKPIIIYKNTHVWGFVLGTAMSKKNNLNHKLYLDTLSLIPNNPVLNWGIWLKNDTSYSPFLSKNTNRRSLNSGWNHHISIHLIILRLQRPTLPLWRQDPAHLPSVCAPWGEQLDSIPMDLPFCKLKVEEMRKKKIRETPQHLFLEVSCWISCVFC